MTIRAERVRASALWAAWADAVGFISELTDARGLRERLGSNQSWPETMEWRRRVGGRFGAPIWLPRGTYSDDTQLRLATGRSISSRQFDIDAFARVEMTVWPSYALGGGRASKSAAANLARPSTRWFTNFYDGYFEAGGNGAAMRIQPHVWALPEKTDLDLALRDVAMNAISTHGHPRAIFGAVLHAVFLDIALQTGSAPGVQEFRSLLKLALYSEDAIFAVPELATVWLPAWERHHQTSFHGAWTEAYEECKGAFDASLSIIGSLQHADGRTDQDKIYGELMGALNLRDAKVRGSGTLTVVASALLSAAFPNDPRAVAEIASAALGTDTDTVATMAAALSGAGATTLPDSDSVQDSEYILQEASRLAGIAEGEVLPPTAYPDLLIWTPPRSQLDAVVKDGERLALTGFGELTTIPHLAPAQMKNQAWAWFQSDFGPTFLLKHRPHSAPLEVDAPKSESRPLAARPTKKEQGALIEPRVSPEVNNPNTSGSQPEFDMDDPAEAMFEWILKGNLNSNRIGYAMIKLAKVATADEFSEFASRLRQAVIDAPSAVSGQ